MIHNDKATVEKLHAVYGRMKEEIALVIVGQEAVIEQVLMAVFCRGHALLVGVPGLAKTLLVSTLAQALGYLAASLAGADDDDPFDLVGTHAWVRL